MNEYSTIENDRYPILFLILSALAVSNIMVAGIYIFFALAIYYIFVVGGGKLSIIGSGRILWIFVIAYFLGLLINGNSITSCFKVIVYGLIWSVSYNLSLGKSIKTIYSFIIVLAFGMAAHGLINYAFNSISGTNMGSGLSYDYWTQSISTATGQAVNFTLFVSIAFGVVFLSKKLTFRIIGICISLCIILYDVKLGGRTCLLLIALSIVLGIILYSFFTFTQTHDIGKLIFVVFSVCFVVILLVYAFEHNLFGIKTMYENSYLFSRITNYNAMDLGGNDRFDKKVSYLTHFTDHMFGGCHFRIDEGFGYAHELWLDLYDEAGLVPFLFLWMFTINACINVYRTVKICKNNNEIKIVLISYIVIMLAQFFVEPILMGSPMLWCAFLLIDGALMAYIRTTNNDYCIEQNNN